MGSAPGPVMMGPRSQQQPPYSPMRQGGMNPQTGKRPADSRPPPPQSKGYCFFFVYSMQRCQEKICVCVCVAFDGILKLTNN